MKKFGYFSLVLMLMTACGPRPSDHAPSQKAEMENSDKEEAEKDSKGFQPFYVFLNKGARENHFIPSGFMPNGKCVEFNDSWQERCHSEKTCIRVVFQAACAAKDEKWGGVYWLNPPNNWG